MKKGMIIVTIGFALFLAVHLQAFAASGPLNMRLTTDTPDLMPQGVAATWFGQEVQKRLPGSQAKVYNASSLMNNMDALEAMHSGTLEACWATMSKISGIVPQGLAVRMPVLFSTYDQAKAIPQTEFGKYVEKAALAKNFVCLGWGIVSPYVGIAAKQRILTVADWKGKKVRVYDQVTQALEVTLAGGSPNFMSWGDFVPAIQSGIVDAGFAGTGSWGPVKETVPYFTSVGIVPDYYLFLVAKKWWESLPPATQAVLKEVAQQASAKQVAAQQESDLISIQKYGTKDPQKIGIYTLGEKELEPYRKLWVAEVEKSIIKAIGSGGKEAVDLVISISKK